MPQSHITKRPKTTTPRLSETRRADELSARYRPLGIAAITAAAQAKRTGAGSKPAR